MSINVNSDSNIPYYTNDVIPTVGGYLDDLFDSVETSINAVIQTAENAILQAEVEAGLQIELAIAAAENAFKDIMQMTIDKVAQAVQDSLNQLNGMVEEFQQRNSDTLTDLTKKVQQYINSFPRSSKAPQVTTSGPNFVVLNSVIPSDNNSSEVPLEPPVDFIFNGNFPCSGNPAYPPTLEFRGTSLPLVNSTTQSLTFRAKASDIFPQSVETNNYAYEVGKLKLPFDDSASLSYWERIRGKKEKTTTYEYKVLETALPKSPGRITAIYSNTIAGEPIQKPFTSSSISTDGNAAYFKGRPCKMWDVHHYSFTPDEGFRFVKGSEVLKVHKGAHGNHYEKISSVQDNEIMTEVGLDACSGKHMGIVSFHVEAQEIQPTTVEVIHQEPINLNWGDSDVIQLNNSNGRLIKIICALFDGSKIEFGTGTDLNNRYIQVRNEGASVKIQALPANKIKV